jgi:RNA polymerase-associated protein CTR9
MFASLAADKSHFIPYSLDIADQRRKYGESMLRKADEHLATQEAYEQEAREKLDAARRRRMDEKERLEHLEVS